MANRKKPDDEANAKTVQVSAKVSPEIYAMLKAKAKSDDRTLAYVVRRLVLDGLGLEHKAAR